MSGNLNTLNNFDSLEDNILGQELTDAQELFPEYSFKEVIRDGGVVVSDIESGPPVIEIETQSGIITRVLNYE